MSINTDSVLPKHIGIIPDGNRRWAKQNGVRLDQAYWYAMQKINMCVERFYSHGALSVCVYLLSKDNVLRARNDLKAVIKAELRFLHELLPSLKTRYDLLIYHAGNPQLLPSEYVSALSALCQSDNGMNDPFPRLYLCAAYDAFEEVVQSISKSKHNPETLLNYLSVPLKLDIVIRTGGDIRISGFLPLQCKYAEFFFESYYFPDISQHRIETVIDKFILRDRRFGR